MTSIRTNKQVADAIFRRRARRTAVTIAAAIAASAIVAACNSSELLDVETPSAVPVGISLKLPEEVIKAQS